jgi:glycosyltransferase involved in cell wall biosynthesis
MRWLQWGTIDFEKGMGGVEMHVRCLSRELRARGVTAEMSCDPAALHEEWDVVHTHGSMSAERLLHPRPGTIRLHTLHGVTLDRMKACGEWLYMGGYRAYFREASAVNRSDGVLSIHDQLSLYQRAQQRAKPTRVCGNAWDASVARDAVPSKRVLAVLEQRGARPMWLFIGRGLDYVKGSDLLVEALARDPRLTEELFWAAVPGEGFEQCPLIHQSGPLTSEDIEVLLREATGLVIPSRYEGLPLVALEALAQGTPVVAHAVGGLLTIPRAVQGLTLVEPGNFPLFSSAIFSAPEGESRQMRRDANRVLLPTWSKVAEHALSLVEEIRRSPKYAL